MLDEWGAWLDREWQWDWFTTLTFDQSKLPTTGTHDVIGWGLSDRYWNEWVGKLTEQSGGDLYWIRGREPNPSNRGTHFHALMGGMKDLRRTAAWAEWRERHGFARILPYGLDDKGRPVEGAARYIAKYVVKELGDLTFSPNLGLMKRNGATNDHGSGTAGPAPDGWRIG